MMALTCPKCGCLIHLEIAAGADPEDTSVKCQKCGGATQSYRVPEGRRAGYCDKCRYVTVR